MPIANFLPLARFERRDVEMMARCAQRLCRRLRRCSDAGVSRLVHDLAAELLDMSATDDLVVFVDKEALLDLAADALNAAGALHRKIRHDEALVLEAIEARMLEALLGLGSIDPTGVSDQRPFRSR